MASMLLNKASCRTAAFGSVRPAVRIAVPARICTVTHSYKNGENIDLSRVFEVAKDAKDTGSSEVQIARLSARVSQISGHLQKNRKDHAAKRGLQQILSQRKKLLQYLYRQDRDSYDGIVAQFGIRSVIVGDTRGATRKADEVAAAATAAAV